MTRSTHVAGLIAALICFAGIVGIAVSSARADTGDLIHGDCRHAHVSPFSGDICLDVAGESNSKIMGDKLLGKLCTRPGAGAGICVQSAASTGLFSPPGPLQCACSPLLESKAVTAVLSQVQTAAKILALGANKDLLKDTTASCPQIAPGVSIIKAALATLDDRAGGSVDVELVSLQLTDLKMIDEVLLVLNDKDSLGKVARQCNVPTLLDDVALIRDSLLGVKMKLLFNRFGRDS